jgi:hypothetical protein
MHALMAAAEIPPLPSPPILERLLLERPLPLVAVLVLLAVVAWWVLSRRGEGRKAWPAGAGLLALAAGVWVLAASVETTRERLAAMTAGLVRAVATGDARAVDAALLESAELTYPLAPTGVGKAAILGLVRDDMRSRYQVREHEVVATHASLDSATTARVQVRVYVLPADYGFPVYSWWLVSWAKDPAGAWRVSDVRSLWINVLDERPGR